MTDLALSTQVHRPPGTTSPAIGMSVYKTCPFELQWEPSWGVGHIVISTGSVAAVCMSVAIVYGTRPEIIKMSPVLKLLRNSAVEHFTINTGQHYTRNLSQVFVDQLGLGAPDYDLGVGSGTHAEETGRMLIAIERVLAERKPKMVLVEGDTNTVLAGGLAAAKLNIRVGHIEAGLRSFDSRMAEELNRVLVDHLSSFLFAPTKVSEHNLRAEGVSHEKISLTGNTVVDAIEQNWKFVEKTPNAFKKKHGNYILLTLHRQENVDDSDRLARIFEGIRGVARALSLEVAYPIHPRTEERCREIGLTVPKEITLMKPVDYFEFLTLVKDACLVATDSGGVQEEACVLRVPCVTLRENTERPETVQVGANIVAGTHPAGIKKCASLMIHKSRAWRNPLGDGKAAKRIVDICRSS